MRVRFGLLKSAKECPYCESERVRRSRRSGALEKSLGRILFLYPYRCEACDGRYFMFGREKRAGLVGEEGSAESADSAVL
jgi:DNA-directed RNA polymerase subunit RPC12/RpoP